jgi:membrane protease YdiL (CAAX protease family)
MEANLAGAGVAKSRVRFPYSNWGPWAGIFGVFAALFVGLILGLPGLAFTEGPKDELTTLGNVIVQAATELGFLSVPIALALMRGARGPGEVLERLGVRRFRASAFGWMALAFVLYLAFTVFYSLVITEPKQKDIAESFGPTVVQVLLIVIAAPIGEELCFRGMLFGGLREKLPRLAAALLTGLIFGGLHALTGVTAVPPLIVFGLLLALLYEKTGSIVPGILLHMLNNSIALLGQ